MYENETSPALPFIYFFFGSFANIVRLPQKRFFFSSIKTTHPKGDLSYFAVRSEFSFGGNALCAMQTTLAHVFTSEGKHLGSENANGCVESCSEGRGEYHACLTRDISIYPLSNYTATDSFMSAMHLQIFFNFSTVL